jgi:hypothetical protein
MIHFIFFSIINFIDRKKVIENNKKIQCETKLTH